MKEILLILAGMGITCSLSLISAWDELVVSNEIATKASLYLIGTIFVLIWGLWL